MRIAYLPLIAVMAMALPAYADGTSDDTPNPFTDQAHTGNITSTDKGVGDFTGPVQGADPQTSAPGDFGSAQGGQSGASSPDNSFYQEKKKADDK